MTDAKHVLRHYLAALAYRTQKALRDAPESFGDFEAGAGTRSPTEIVRHMTSVLGYARTLYEGGVYRAEPLDDLEAEVARFHGVLTDLARRVDDGTPLRGVTREQLLQGPLADAMTHVGQLAMLRRLAGSPVASENFLMADVSADRLGVDQALPAAPTPVWMGKLIDLAWRITRWTNRRR